MSSKSTLGAAKRARRRARAAHATDTHDSSPQTALPGLPNHLVVTLRSDYFDDPADLARLRVVSRPMRAAVAATGRQVEQLGFLEAVKIGCLSEMERLQRRGQLPHEA